MRRLAVGGVVVGAGAGTHTEARGGERMTARRTFDREALSHADALYNHGRRLTRSDGEAEELVQETFVRAFAGAHTFVGGNLKGWLFRIQRNAFIDLYRKGRQQPVLGELDVVDGADERELIRGDRELDHLRQLVSEEIEAALAELSEEARAIILLDVEGFTETEVADVLGCALGTVKSRLHRARTLLRERLEHYGVGK
jgi:RNA polymerase sigma-70 factor, ECF subfamily